MKTLLIAILLTASACGQAPHPIANQPGLVYMAGRSGDCLPCGGIPCPEADACVCGNIMELNAGTSKPFCMTQADWVAKNF